MSRSLCPGSLDRGHLSWGSFAPSTLEEERVHVPFRLPDPGSLVVPGGAPASPTSPATVPLAGFPNLTAACSSPRRPAIFRRVAFVGFGPSGNCSFHEAPTTRRRRTALLTLLPSDWPCPRPRRGHPWALQPVPRSFRLEPLVAYRAFFLVEIDLGHRAMISETMTDLSLLGLCLLMV